MIRSLQQVSRPVLVLEMVLCFLPITWMLGAVVANASHGLYSPVVLLLYLSGTLVGPIGLVVAGRAVLLKAATSRTSAIVTSVLAAWTFLAYILLHVSLQGNVSWDWWRTFILMVLLPALAVAHFSCLESGSPGAQAAH